MPDDLWALPALLEQCILRRSWVARNETILWVVQVAAGSAVSDVLRGGCQASCVLGDGARHAVEWDTFHVLSGSTMRTNEGNICYAMIPFAFHNSHMYVFVTSDASEHFVLYASIILLEQFPWNFISVACNNYLQGKVKKKSNAIPLTGREGP
jgi:hypothetical protein